MALNARQLTCIEVMLANPSASYEKLAEIVGCNRNTITAWKRNEEFQAEYSRRLKEMWKDSEGIAVKTMIKLADEGNFQASKYILDSMNYAPAQKIEADVKAKAQIVFVDDLQDKNNGNTVE